MPKGKKKNRARRLNSANSAMVQNKRPVAEETIDDLKAKYPLFKSSHITIERREPPSTTEIAQLTMEIEQSTIEINEHYERNKMPVLDCEVKSVMDTIENCLDSSEKANFLMNKVSALEKRNSELKCKFDEMKKNFHSRENSHDNLRFKVTMFEKKYKDASLELEEMENRLSTFNTIVKEKEEMDIANKKLKDLKKKLEEDVKRLKDEKSKDIAALKKKHAKKQSESQKVLKTIRQKKKKLEKDLNQITDSYGTSLRQTSALEKSNNDFKQRLESLTKECDEMKRLKEEMHAEVPQNNVCEMEINELCPQQKEEMNINIQHFVSDSKHTQTIEDFESIEELKQKEVESQREIKELKLKEILLMEKLELQFTEGHEKLNDCESQLACCKETIDQLKAEKELTSFNLNQEIAKTMQLQSNIIELTDRVIISETVCENLKMENQKLIDSEVDRLTYEKIINDLKSKEEIMINDLKSNEKMMIDLKSKEEKMIDDVKSKEEKMISDLKSKEKMINDLKSKEEKMINDVKSKEEKIINDLKIKERKMINDQKSKKKMINDLKSKEEMINDLKSKEEKIVNDLKSKEEKIRELIQLEKNTKSRMFNITKEAEKKYKDLKAEMDYTGNKYKELENDHETQKQIILYLEEEMQRCQKSIEDQDQEITSLKETEHDLEENIISMKEKVRVLKINLAEKHKMLNNLTQDLEASNQAKDVLSNENCKQTKLIEELHVTLEQKSKTLEEKAAQFETNREEERKLTCIEQNMLSRRNDELQLTLNELIEKNKALEEQYIIIQYEKAEEKKLLDADNDTLQHKLITIEKESLELRNQLAQKSKTLEEKAAQFETNREEERKLMCIEQNKMSRRNDELQLTLNELIEKNKALEDQYTIMQYEKAEEKKLLEADNDTLQLKIINIEKESLELRNQFAQKSKTLEEKAAQFETNREEERKLTCIEQNMLSRRNDELQLTLNELIEKNKALEDQYTIIQYEKAEEKKLLEADNDTLQHKIISIEKESLELRNQLAQKSKTLEEKAAQFETNREEEKKLTCIEQNKMSRRNDELQLTVNELIEKKKALEEQYTIIQYEKAEEKKLLEADNDTLQHKIISIEKELLELRNQFAEKDRASEERLAEFQMSFNIEIKKKNAKCKELKIKLAKHKKTLVKRLSNWKDHFRQKFLDLNKSKFDRLVAEMDELLEMNNELQLELNVKNNKEKTLAKELDTLKESAEKEMNMLRRKKDDELAKLQKENAGLHRNIKSLEIKIQLEYLEELSSLKIKYSKCKSEMEKLQKYKDNIEEYVPETNLKQENEYLKLCYEDDNERITELFNEVVSLKRLKSLALDQLRFYQTNNNTDALSDLQLKMLKLEKDKEADQEKIEKCEKENKKLLNKCRNFRDQLEIVYMKNSLAAGHSYAGAREIQKDLKKVAGKDYCTPKSSNHPLLKPNDDFTFIKLGKPLTSQKKEKKNTITEMTFRSRKRAMSGDIHNLHTVPECKIIPRDTLTEEQKKAEGENQGKFRNPFNPFDDEIYIPDMSKFCVTYPPDIYTEGSLERRRKKLRQKARESY